MLSKFNYFKRLKLGYFTNKDGIFSYTANMCRIIEDEIGCKVLTISPADVDSTLGVIFKVVTENGLFFLKTHAKNEECKTNLLKESHIFHMLYDNVVFCRTLELNHRNFFFTEELSDADSYPEVIIKSMLANERKLCDFNPALINYTFEKLLEIGGSSLQNLCNNSLIDKQIYNQCVNYLEILKNANFETCICHGDLSNKNIKQKNNILVLIDWEDSFIGPVYYDFLYWLTFFDNKKFLTKENIAKVPYELKVSIALLLLIVVVKCEISFLNNSYLTNKVSFDSRLYDILELGKL